MTARSLAVLVCLALLAGSCERPATEVTTSTGGASTTVTTTTVDSTATSAAGAATSASTFPEEATTTTAAPDVLLVTPYGRVGGVELGTEFDDALPNLVEVFGEPDDDTGWQVGCPLDGEDDNERVLRWGALAAHFYLVDTGRFIAWTIDADRGSVPRGATVVLPGGSTLGEPMSAVAASTGLEVLLDGVFEAAIVTEDGYTMWGFPDSLDAPLSLIGVPYVPVCE